MPRPWPKSVKKSKITLAKESNPKEVLQPNQNDVILSGNRPLRAASGSVHRVLRLVPLLRDPNYSEQGRDRGAQAVRAGRYTICTAP